MTTIARPQGASTNRSGLRFRRLGILFLAVLVAVSALLVYRYGPWADDGPSRGAVVLPATSSLATGASDADIAKLQAAIKAKPDDFASYLSLAGLYMQKVRESGDPTYYTKTDDLLKRANVLDPTNPDLLASEGTLALARHDFGAALAFGKQALAADSERSRYYGVVADAQIELGNYPEAINALQEMTNRKPDFSAFSRIAYARELYGDPEGAIEALQFAIQAGSSVHENLAWAHAQLGDRYFSLGRINDAGSEYSQALTIFPDYPVATAGLAQLAVALGDLTKASTLYQQAFDRMPLPQYAIALGDIAAKQGDRAKAQREYGLVQAIDQLYQANGSNTDLEIALYYADHGIKLPDALTRARAAYAARPSVHTAEALGWTLYKMGNAQEAEKYALESLKLGTRDSNKLFRAGMVEKALGKNDQAKDLLEQAVTLNPHFSLLYADDATAALATLGK